MQQFELYTQAWAVYIVLGIILLYMLDVKLRKTGFKRRVATLSLIATGAFTPHLVKDSDSYAPLLLTSLFDAEIQGASALIQGFLTLIIIWGIIFACVLALRHFVQATKTNQSQSSSIKNN